MTRGGCPRTSGGRQRQRGNSTSSAPPAPKRSEQECQRRQRRREGWRSAMPRGAIGAENLEWAGTACITGEASRYSTRGPRCARRPPTPDHPPLSQPSEKRARRAPPATSDSKGCDRSREPGVGGHSMHHRGGPAILDTRPPIRATPTHPKSSTPVAALGAARGQSQNGYRARRGGGRCRAGRRWRTCVRSLVLLR